MIKWQDIPLCGNLQLYVPFSQKTTWDFQFAEEDAERRSGHGHWIKQAKGIKRDQEGLQEIMQMLLDFQPGL